MSYFFTTFFRQQLTATPTMIDAKTIKLVLFRYAPAFDFPSDTWLAVKTVADLRAIPGWQEVGNVGGYPLTRTVNINSRTLAGQPNNRYVMYSQYQFDGLLESTAVDAIGVVLIGSYGGTTDPLMFVTDSPLGNGTVLYPGDALTSNPDTSFPDSTNRWLFSWVLPSGGGAQANPVEGPLSLSRDAPSFEAANSQHVWMYPQRANMVANPSFELPGTGYWLGNGALTRVSGGAPGAGAFAGSCAGSTPIMESNYIPARLGEEYAEQWTVQLMIKGSGPCKVGLVWWDNRSTKADWGQNENWVLTPNSWTHIAVHRTTPQAYMVMLRIEATGGPITIDQVLVERGYLKDWQYFDGDELYGARDDFTWYGGINRKGASYSFWYSSRRAVYGRLFAKDVDVSTPGPAVTDEDIEEQGLVYRWVPAGIAVIPHMDVLYPYDPQSQVPARTGSITPYYNVTTAPDGVRNPWV